MTIAPSTTAQPQPWIYSAWVDGLFILLPPFVSLLVVVSLPGFFREDTDMPPAAWFILVLLVDVAHVYSTLYRTYFDRETFTRQKGILTGIPLAGWVVGVIFYSLDSLLFWRILAYVAVFHFIRQQYGFMRIYSRKESSPRLFRKIDTLTIYAATVYPIVYWHLNPDRNFDWFLKGDFLSYPSPRLTTALTLLYFITIGIYLVKEITLSFQTRQVNIPRVGVITGTLVSWYFGIVYFNGDLIFTTLNVISHGIPYMALVWVYGRKRYLQQNSPNANHRMRTFFTGYGIILFLLLLFGLAYLEEGFWDAMVWNDHPELFPAFRSLPALKDVTLLSLVVPLLALPQITHYILDGFIWKLNKDSFNWKQSTLDTTQ